VAAEGGGLSAVALAFVAGALGVLGAGRLAGEGARLARARSPRLAGAVGALVETVARAGREGRDPAAAERRRLLAAGAALAFSAGVFVAGPRAGVVAGLAGPFALSRVLLARRERYRVAVEDGAADIALAVSDALAGGHSLRGAVGAAARSLVGPPGRELRRVDAELALGARTEDAMEAMRARIRGQGVDTIVAACLLQREAGGDLARLLRDCARAADDAARLAREARAATAQARFTGLLVVLLPLGGAVLAELASPGFLRGLASSFLTAWLAGVAVVLQVVAAVLIRRLARVRA
jgi:tight adherence protein B